MTKSLKPFLRMLCLFGMIALPVYADNQHQTAENLQIAMISSKTDSLKTELANLQKQLNSIKSNIKKGQSTTSTAKSAERSLSSKGKTALAYNTNNTNSTVSGQSTDGSVGIDTVTPEIDRNTRVPVPDDKPGRLSRDDILRMMTEQAQYLPFDLDVPGQAFVSTGPYVGVPIQFSGSNLIINSPSVNTDVQLLTIRKSIYKQLVAMGGEIFSEPFHSHLLLSGVVQSQANYTDFGGAPSRSDIDVTNMSFDLFFLGPSKWLLGFIEFSHDNALPNFNYFRVANSRIFLNKAFVTIGDFSVSPFYGSFGQFYVPFGTYSSVMVTDTLTKSFARTKARAIQIGFYQQEDNALYGAAYIFRGDSHAASVSKINNGGLNLGYRFKYGKIGGNVGGGVIANIADSAGMQLGTGFALYEQLVHRVPAYNVRGMLNLGERVDFIVEWIGASTSFNPNDMSYNGRGAKPWAIDSQLATSFFILDDRPSSLAIGYAHTAQALAMGLPMSRYSLAFNTSLWKNTLQSLEIRRDNNYAASHTGNGPTGAITPTDSCTSIVCTASGKTDKAITASFDYYF